MIKAMKAVYCYYFPEVRRLLRETVLPDEMFLVNTSAKLIEKKISKMFDPPLEIPATEEGRVSLDEVHVPVIKRIVKAYSEVVKGLENFNFVYPTSGSNEGIFHLLVKAKEPIYVLDGEYEGYLCQARNIGKKVIEIDPDSNFRVLEKGTWFISNPSARNGNILPNEFINRLGDLGHKIVLDLAYAGMTKKHVFDIAHPNIEYVVSSLSKPFGVFRHRIGGFTFSKSEIPTLYGNKWFKDILRLMQALKIVEEIGFTGLYDKYSKIQNEIVSDINKEYGLQLKCSDVFLLAHSTQEHELLKNYRRGKNYRLCLTPYFEERES